MRIFYVALSELPSRYANSIHVMKMCAALADKHDVTLYVPDKNSNRLDLFEYYGVAQNFIIKKLYWARLRGRGYIFAFCFLLECLLKRPDLVYGRCLLACVFSCLVARIPTRYEAHAPIGRYDFIHQTLFKLMYRSRKFERLIVISDALRNIYSADGCTEKVTVAHDGADESKYSVRLKAKNRDRRKVGYFGHLYAGRGLELIVSCAARLPEVDFFIYGGNDDDIKLWQMKRMPCNVVFEGFIEPSRVDEVRSACDILVAPYQEKVSIQNTGDSAKYMSPLKIFEYMSSGIPIICSDLPVIREVLNDRNSILVSPKDLDAWVGAIGDLADNDGLCRQLGERALADFNESYKWSSRARHVVQ